MCKHLGTCSYYPSAMLENVREYRTGICAPRCYAVLSFIFLVAYFVPEIMAGVAEIFDCGASLQDMNLTNFMHLEMHSSLAL